MNFISKLSVLGILTLGAGCASINSVSLTPIPSQRSNQVRSQVEKTIILAFNFDNDFINPLVNDLKRQCPGGVVSGILTKDEVISYIFVHTRRVVATGYCSTAAVATSKGRRNAASVNDDSAATVDAESGL